MYCNTKRIIQRCHLHRSHNARVYCSVYFTEINNSIVMSCKTEMQVEARSKQNTAHCIAFLLHTTAVGRHCSSSTTASYPRHYVLICNLTKE
jgi:hypothetical protein